MDNSTLVLLGIYHGQSNPDHIDISAIDKLIEIANKFEDRYGETNWEDSDVDWADSVALYYNDMKDRNWNSVEMSETDPNYRVKKEMGAFISNDEEDYDKVIKALKKALKKKGNSPLEYVKEILVWEKVQDKFTVKEFCDLIGLTN